MKPFVVFVEIKSHNQKYNKPFIVKSLRYEKSTSSEYDRGGDAILKLVNVTAWYNTEGDNKKVVYV
jgi:hypothetical protein